MSVLFPYPSGWQWAAYQLIHLESHTPQEINYLSSGACHKGIFKKPLNRKITVHLRKMKGQFLPFSWQFFSKSDFTYYKACSYVSYWASLNLTSLRCKTGLTATLCEYLLRQCIGCVQHFAWLLARSQHVVMVVVIAAVGLVVKGQLQLSF